MCLESHADELSLPDEISLALEQFLEVLVTLADKYNITPEELIQLTTESLPEVISEYFDYLPQKIYS